MTLEPGLAATFRYTVAEADTAVAVGSGEVPVLGTPRVLALAERATVAAVAEVLEAGTTTVGVRVELDHLAPSAVGADLEVTAVLERVTGPGERAAGGGRAGDGGAGRAGHRLIADFDRHHPRFLPPTFSEFRVEEGGVGAGTVHSFKMTAEGRARAFRMWVAEPEPGRVLTESDAGSSMVTTWVVTPEGPRYARTAAPG